jgi:hypothetical protein
MKHQNISVTGSLNLNGVGVATTANLNAYTASSNSKVDALIAQTGSYATTGSNTFTGAQVVQGTLTAQTLVVQTVTSSVLFSTGSNKLGSSLSNVQELTGSVGITGSLAINGTTAVVGSGTVNELAYFTASGTIASLTVATYPSLTELSYVKGVTSAIQTQLNAKAATLSGTTNYIPKFTSSSAIGNSNLINDANGNLGLGVTPSAWNLGKVIEIGNLGNFIWGLGSNDIMVGAGFYYFNGFKYVVSGSAVSAYEQASGTHTWYTAPSGTAGNAITFTQAMTLTAAGRLLINTPTESTYQLDVNGTGRFSRNDAANISVTIANAYINQGNLLNFQHNTAGSTTNGYIGHGGDNTGNFVILNNGITALSLARASGAATFSSSVTAASRIVSFSTTYGLFHTDSPSYNVYIDTRYISADNGYLLETGKNGANAVPYLALGTADTERMRITSGGYLKASNNGTYYDAAASYYEFKSNASDNTIFVWNSSASPNGIFVNYTNSPNGTGNNFLNFYDGNVTTQRFAVRSNGGIANYQANNVNLSDERTKKDISPLDSYWNKFKDIEIVKFKYKDQSHDDFNIGVISQQVESVAPEFVDIDGFGTTPEDGIPLKSIYTADLYHATIKVLQEAMIKIEELSAKVTLLENK